jgi:hypothetical protein
MGNDREGVAPNKVSLISDPMDQMREYLFGDARRQSDESLRALDQKIEAIRLEFLARFNALESRMDEITRINQQAQAQSLDLLGSALTDLGGSLRARAGQPKGD